MYEIQQTTEEEAAAVVQGTLTYPLFQVFADLVVEPTPLLKHLKLLARG